MTGYSYRLPARYRYRLPRKYRCRPLRRAPNRDRAIGLALGAVLIAGTASGGKAVASRHHGAHGVKAQVTAITIPGSSDLGTPGGWAHALLAALSDPQTSCNFNAVTEWEAREGGGFGNQAAFNPLNVNPGAGAGWPGSPAIGAWAFPDARTGLRYTVMTLGNGDYGGILAALRAGNDAQAVCNAIMASPWAASHYDGTLTAAC